MYTGNKKTVSSILITAFVLFSLIGVALSVNSEEPAGKKGVVTFLEGSAKKQKLVDIEWATVNTNSEVIGGERLRTFAKSRAELDLAKLDKIRMAPKTTIAIDKLYEETKDQVLEAKITLQEGDLWANVQKKDQTMKLSIGTPVAAAAITGTTLRVSVNKDSSAELKVYNGEVIVSNSVDPLAAAKSQQQKLGQPQQVAGPTEVAGPHEVTMEEWVVIVKEMQKVTINKNGTVSYSGEFSKNDADEQSDWVKWNQEMDQKSGIQH